eukprot:8407601-Alexandrium_andersonii.AAC.1
MPRGLRGQSAEEPSGGWRGPRGPIFAGCRKSNACPRPRCHCDSGGPAHGASPGGLGHRAGVRGSQNPR